MPRKRIYTDDTPKPPAAKRRKQEDYRYVAVIYSESSGRWKGYGVLDGARPFAEVDHLQDECAKLVRIQQADAKSSDNEQKRIKDLCARELKSNSKYIGVSWKAGKWRARVIHDRKQYHVGYFDSEILAAKAVNKKCDDLGIDVKNPSVYHLEDTFLKAPLVLQEFTSKPKPAYIDIYQTPKPKSLRQIRSPIIEIDKAPKPPIIEIDMTRDRQTGVKKGPIVTIDMTMDSTPEPPNDPKMNLPVIEIDTGKAHYSNSYLSNPYQSRFTWLSTDSHIDNEVGL